MSTDTPNPFNPQSLRITPAHVSGMAQKQVLTIPVVRPPKQDWIRTHHKHDYHMDIGLLELKDERETYAVVPEVYSELTFECVLVSLIPYINRTGTLRLWPLKIPGADGRENDWHTSARAAAVAASKEWIRVFADMSAGSYAFMRAAAPPPEPTWPDMTFDDMVKTAFRNGTRVITSLDHPVIKLLQAR
jgi:hypothetical protein